MKAIDLNKKLSTFKAHWSPHRIAKVDDMHVLLAKLKGPFVWHLHHGEDELFQVLKGTLLMEFRDRTETVGQGQIIVVPKGVEHRPTTKDEEEVHVLLFEKQVTKHTGQIQNERTREHYPDI